MRAADPADLETLFSLVEPSWARQLSGTPRGRHYTFDDVFSRWNLGPPEPGTRPHGRGQAGIDKLAVARKPPLMGSEGDENSGEPTVSGRNPEHPDLLRQRAAEDAGLRVTVGWAPWKCRLAETFFHLLGTELRHPKALPAAVEMVNDAGELLKFLREHRLTKYNVGGDELGESCDLARCLGNGSRA